MMVQAKDIERQSLSKNTRPSAGRVSIVENYFGQNSEYGLDNRMKHYIVLKSVNLPNDSFFSLATQFEFFLILYNIS